MGLIKFGFVILLAFFFDNVLSQNSEAEDVEDFEPSTIITLETSERIVGGRNAEEGQFPYQVSLRYRNNHHCGGAIISPIFVVTAAHCISSNVRNKTQVYPLSYLGVRAGTALVDTGGITVPIAQIIPHPNYENFKNDIALLRLNTTLNFTQFIRPIPLVTTNMTSGSPVLVSGWGRLRNRGSSPTPAPLPTRLQYVTLSAMTNAECQRRTGRIRQWTLCLAHPSGQGICKGDSGGPAAFNNQLVGVANFVTGGCGSRAPDGFANISYFATWIRQTTNL